jgi:hypothetical protein
LESRREEFAIVADDGFAEDFDPELVQLFRKEKGIGVQAIGSKELRSNGDDFCFHHCNDCSSPLVDDGGWHDLVEWITSKSGGKPPHSKTV